jgi:hypothetical protein
VRSPSLSRSMRGGESTVRSGNSVLTLFLKNGGVSKWDGFSWEAIGGLTTHDPNVP